MFQFWEKNRKKIVTGIVLCIIAVSLFFGRHNLNASAFESAIGFIVTPFQDLTTGIGSWVDSRVSSARDKTELLTENEQLRSEVSRLQEENKRLALYESENKTLSDLLNITQRFPQYKSIGARVTAKSPGMWYEVFTIDKGTMDEVSANMVVVTSGGVVGRVTESGANYSSVQSILDSRSSVPAKCLRTGDLGVVKGEYTLAGSGYIKMEYIDAEAEIVVGDEIVTSHLSDIYPEGLSIGRVIQIELDSNGLTKYAVIEPFVDLKHLDTVLVIDKNVTEDAS